MHGPALEASFLVEREKAAKHLIFRIKFFRLQMRRGYHFLVEHLDCAGKWNIPEGIDVFKLSGVNSVIESLPRIPPGLVMGYGLWDEGYGLCVAHVMLQDEGCGLCVADDMLQDDRNMLRQESLIPGCEHLGQCWGNLGAIFG